MALFRIVLLLIAAVSVSACSSQQTTTRNVTSSAQLVDDRAQQAQQLDQVALGAFMPNAKIEAITVRVAQNLTVSEKNSYYPRADIVWRGDILGNRHEQVATILKDSAQRAAAKMNGTRPVHMHIEVTRFHGVSEKARYSTGGVHNMNFVLTLTDPSTGIVLRGPRQIVSNLDALKGIEAITADARGETQKVRVTSFLEQVLLTELTTPGGYVDHNKGFFVALNRQR